MKINQEKKKIERDHLLGFCGSLKLSYEVEDSERPDFILRNYQEVIGVEHTIVLNEYELNQSGIVPTKKEFYWKRKRFEKLYQKRKR